MIVVTLDPDIVVGHRVKVTIEQVSTYGVRREVAVSHVPVVLERPGSGRVNASAAIVEALRALPSLFDKAP